MYDRILLPTDGAATTDRALEHAVDLARRYDAELHVLYVIDSAAFASDLETGSITEEFEEAADAIVDEVTERARDAGLEDVVGAVVRGTPHERILEYADERGADLIVMGTHGRTGLHRFLLGSVTEKVIRLSETPVLTVRRPGE